MTLTLEELAMRLRKSPRTLRRILPVLTRDHGFPRRLPGLGPRWSADAVDAWMIRQPGMTPQAPANDDYLAVIRQRLLERHA